MWIAKHLKLSHAYSVLEMLTAERTAELQKLTHRLLKVQDEERRKLARDLHDTTGQTLAALKIAVSQLEETCKQTPAALQIVSEVEQLADQAIGEIRTMSYLLHPPLLDEVGFACAAEWYIEGFAKRSGINVQAEIAKTRGALARKRGDRSFPCPAGELDQRASPLRRFRCQHPFSTRWRRGDSRGARFRQRHTAGAPAVASWSLRGNWRRFGRHARANARTERQAGDRIRWSRHHHAGNPSTLFDYSLRPVANWQHSLRISVLLRQRGSASPGRHKAIT